jgi:5-methylcytosine-specific restriction endonuclease McrA
MHTGTGRCASCVRVLGRGRQLGTQERARKHGYNTALWRRISKAVIARDGACVHCGSTSDLTAGHLRYPARSAADAQCECRACNGRDGATRQAGSQAREGGRSRVSVGGDDSAGSFPVTETRSSDFEIPAVA